MLIGVNSKHQIKQIKEITDERLTTYELDESIPTYPFKDFCDLKILCYCYKKVGDNVSVYPYIDSNMIDLMEKKDDEDNIYLVDIDFRLTLMEMGVL